MPIVIKWFTITCSLLVIFLIVCYLLAFHSAAISQSVLGTNIFLGFAAISVFGFPLAFIKLVNIWLSFLNNR